MGNFLFKMLIILDYNRLCADNFSIIYIGNAVIYYSTQIIIFILNNHLKVMQVVCYKLINMIRIMSTFPVTSPVNDHLF